MTTSPQDHMAAHEAGHALMAYLEGDRNVEIRCDWAGWLTSTTQAPWNGQIGLKRKSLKNRYLRVCAAGEAAELTLLGNTYMPQVSMAIQDLNNDAARFLIASKGDHAIYDSGNQPTMRLVSSVRDQFDPIAFKADWDAYINHCVGVFGEPEANAALKNLLQVALSNANLGIPVNATQLVSIAQAYGV